MEIRQDLSPSPSHRRVVLDFLAEWLTYDSETSASCFGEDLWEVFTEVHPGTSMTTKDFFDIATEAKIGLGVLYFTKGTDLPAVNAGNSFRGWWYSLAEPNASYEAYVDYLGSERWSASRLDRPTFWTYFLSREPELSEGPDDLEI